jgi:putative membrane-bound dehydrogenase-like protein
MVRWVVCRVVLFGSLMWLSSGIAAEPDATTFLKAVTSSGAEAGNPAAHAVDGNKATRWAVKGKHAWMQLEFEKDCEVSEAHIGFTKGQGRKYAIKLEGSPDGKTWLTLFEGASKGVSDSPETFSFSSKSTLRFFRLTSLGNNQNDWINVHTLVLPGAHESGVTSAVASEAPDALTVELWAENPLVASPVGISFDHQGRAYVTRVRRRKRSSLDIRQHRDWVKNDLAIQHIDDRLAFYKTAAKGVKDFNEDGVKDWKDLAGEKEEILCVVDTDGDGKADKKILVDGDLGSPVTGIAASTLWLNGDVYAAVEPDIWKYTDTDGDGMVDKRSLIATGFSIHIGQGGHNMSGLTVGFDGKIYWSVADKGINATGSDGSKVFLPNRGGVMRCNPDGSQLEVFAPGVRNGQELAFDEFGYLFTVDNDGDYPGERERFLYLMEGGEIGWRLNWQWFGLQDFAKVSGEKPYNVWMEEQLFKPRWDGQAAYIVPPLANYSNGPCGFKYNPGTALNEKYRGHFFLAQGKSLHAFQVEPAGASFQMVGEHQVSTGPWNTGLAFGPDGALYMCDWMSGPSERGRIWRVDDSTAGKNPWRIETQKILAQGMESQAEQALSDYLGHADMRVRRDAQFELVRRGCVSELLAAASQQGNAQLARLHGTWGLGQLGRLDADCLMPLVKLLGDEDDEVRGQVVKVLGEAKLKAATSAAVLLLKDPSIRVRTQAAIALGKLGADETVAPLFLAAAENDDGDAYLRHAIVMGLHTADPELLKARSGHESKAVRLVALLALRRQAHPGVGIFLNDADPYIVTEAARAIHDDLSIPEALPELAKALTRTDVPGEPFLRRAINANFRVGSEADAARLAEYAARPDAPESMRATALACLALWGQPPVLDAVEGRYRKHAPRDPAVAGSALAQVAQQLAASDSARVMQVSAKAIENLKTHELLPLVHAMYNAKSANGSLRAQLLATMHALSDPALGSYVKKALDDSDDRLRASAQKYAASAGLSGMELAERALAKGTLVEKQGALRNLGDAEDERADTLLGGLLKQLETGAIDPKIALDVLMAAKRRPVLNEAVTSYEEKLSEHGRLAPYLSAVQGGDAELGKSIAQGHPAAQCIRCHNIGDSGGILGPDISDVAKRLTPDQILESLIVPEAVLADGFGLLIATMKDGTSLSGTVTEKTETQYTLLLADGKKRTIERNALKSELLTSAMPPMSAILTPEEVRDLMAYLLTLQ